MVQNTNKFKQTNAFAMQYGLLLGVWGILSLCVMVQSFNTSSLSLLCTLMMIGSPVVAAQLTMRFRNKVMLPEEGFTFGRGFLFTFLSGVYASLWIAFFVFVYLAYFDKGYVFDTYESMMLQPEYVAQMQQSGLTAAFDAVGGLGAVVDAMRQVPPANYAGIIIYTTVLSAPVFSAVIALICRRSPQFPIDK